MYLNNTYLGFKPFLFGLHCSPNGDTFIFFKTIESLLDKIVSKVKHLIIVGDFNIIGFLEILFVLSKGYFVLSGFSNIV